MTTHRIDEEVPKVDEEKLYTNKKGVKRLNGTISVINHPMKQES